MDTLNPGGTMKKLVTILFTVFLLISNLGIKVDAENIPPPNVSGDGVVLMDATTGQILYGRNVDEQFPPASTTKIMTALLTIENTKPDDVVTISNDFTIRDHALLDGNSLCLQNGEQIKVKDLLYGLLLRSANDAAVALAEHISGSVSNFANLMNERAKELGCTTASFQNPNGLYNKDHKVSAKDLALILRKLAEYPEFREIATTESYTIPPTNKTNQAKSVIDRSLINEDKLIFKGSSEYYEGIEGGKTGYTIQSLHSYVAVATRNNERLIVTIMHGNVFDSYFDDARALFDYGFNNFKLNKAYSKGQIVTYYTEADGKKIPLVAAEDFYYVTDKNSQSKPTFKFNNSSIKVDKFTKGELVTNINLKLDSKSIGNLNLLSGINYSPNVSRPNSLMSSLRKLYIPYVVIGILAVVLLSALMIRKMNFLKKEF
jgi:D-alanyl-D-alanine carboxypeptidase (penicillin-binding protein 5/6)